MFLKVSGNPHFCGHMSLSLDKISDHADGDLCSPPPSTSPPPPHSWEPGYTGQSGAVQDSVQSGAVHLSASECNLDISKDCIIDCAFTLLTAHRLMQYCEVQSIALVLKHSSVTIISQWCIAYCALVHIVLKMILFTTALYYVH